LTGQKYSIDKIIQFLSEAKMTSVSAVCRKYDIGSSMFYRWQKHNSNASAFLAPFLQTKQRNSRYWSQKTHLSRDSWQKKNWKTLRFGISLKKTTFKGCRDLYERTRDSCSRYL